MICQPLSTEAKRLLCVLPDPDGPPITDHRLAELCHLPPREIIDAAGELLEHGYLALADHRGRWLGTVDQARRYEQSLGIRGKKILIRRRNLRRAIEANARNQLGLFN